MASEAPSITFANYAPLTNPPEDIYRIGADKTHPGVIKEMATAFNYQLSPKPDAENLGGLIKRVGPAKELQQNIGSVQAALGTDASAVELTRDWALRSGLLVPVRRALASGRPFDGKADAVLMTAGVQNWTNRQAQIIEDLHKPENGGIQTAILAGGTRVMNEASGDYRGMTEAQYLKEVIAQQLGAVGVNAVVVEVDSEAGGEVARGAVQKAREIVEVSGRLVVASVAGAWPQRGGQIREAARSKAAFGPQFDQNGDQLMVVTDEFKLGTGTEPTQEYQNPFTAAGIIARNARAFRQQYAA